MNFVRRVLLWGVLLSPSYCFAYSCDTLPSSIDDSSKWLKRAANETDFDSAKNYMRKAKNSLEEASYGARDCGCDYAASEFDGASTKARRARGASDVDDFNYQFSRAVKSYKAALDALSLCR
ncbi:hypothetical protein KBB49_04030 [Candidatus Saccharibacteria bacterium]|nr:hypothetical protein [Candidatus Saccharibacteria bacterium]